VTTLALTSVTYAYPGAASPALRDVSLEVEPGEFVVLAGGSGSGKSTLLRAAAGLVPHFHGGTFAGRLECGGLDTREHGPAELAAVAGTLFQDPETQVVMATVRSELAFPLENRGWSAAAVARGVEEAALALGIASLLDRSTRELSGGELQRVGDRGHRRRAPARALPAGRRPRDRARRRRARLRRRARRVRRLGATRAAAAGHAPVRARRRARPPGHRQGRPPSPRKPRKGV
jgi:ABC-type taurine transport system ATPase subunit